MFLLRLLFLLGGNLLFAVVSDKIVPGRELKRVGLLRLPFGGVVVDCGNLFGGNGLRFEIVVIPVEIVPSSASTERSADCGTSGSSELNEGVTGVWSAPALIDG